VKLPATTRRLQLLWARLDPYVTRGVAKRHREGMKYLWWYGVFLAMSDAFAGPTMTLFIFALGGRTLRVR